MAADYQNDFERTEEGWRFRHVRLNERFRVPVSQDWGLAPLGSTTLNSERLRGSRVRG